MILKKYDKSLCGEWDNFVNSSRNGTWMNTRKFLNYHKLGKFYDESLMFYKKNKLVAVFPAAKSNKDCKTIDDFYFSPIKSHPGSTYGGIIISNECKTKDVMEIIDLIINYYGTTIIIRTCPRIYHKYPSDEVEFSLFKSGFNLSSVSISSCIDLREYDSSLQEKNHRIAIRQAKTRGVEIQETLLIEDFYEILKRNLNMHKSNPVHSIIELYHLIDSFPNNVKVFVAKKDSKTIAGVLVFIKNDVVHTQYMATDYNYQKDRPMNLLVDFLMKYYKNKKYLNFGISTDGFSGELNEGLVRFKEGFGARGVIRSEWTKEL